MKVSIDKGVFTIRNFLGEKVPRTLKLKENVDVKVDGEMICVKSSDKELAGQTAACIELLTRRPGYDYRVFQDGCFIVNKAGREMK